MTIVPLIRQVVQERFGPFFDSIEGFFLKNFLILIQGLLTNSYTSISAIAAMNTTAFPIPRSSAFFNLTRSSG